VILKGLGYQKWEISILLVDDPQITKLNKTYLNRNRPTDVIAFSQIEGAFSHLNDHANLLGDLVISLETAKRHAQEEKTTIKDEVAFLLIHGILHLLGYDHEGSLKKAREMETKQDEILASLRHKVLQKR
jgi:probable rRNA maturation factor